MYALLACYALRQKKVVLDPEIEKFKNFKSARTIDFVRLVLNVCPQKFKQIILNLTIVKTACQKII